MEQVIPGADDDDWDSDPIIEAADLHHAGQHRAAIRLLAAELAADVRCIDAWGHLGLIAFNTRGPGPAAELPERYHRRRGVNYRPSSVVCCRGA